MAELLQYILFHRKYNKSYIGRNGLFIKVRFEHIDDKEIDLVIDFCVHIKVTYFLIRGFYKTYILQE